MSRWDRYVLRPRIWMETSISGTVPHIGPYTVVGTAGTRAPKGVSLGALRCNGLRVPHPTRLETRTKESDMRASRRVLKPGMRKEADEREAFTVRTAGRP